MSAGRERERSGMFAAVLALSRMRSAPTLGLALLMAAFACDEASQAGFERVADAASPTQDDAGDMAAVDAMTDGEAEPMAPRRCVGTTDCDCDFDRDGELSARCGGTDCDEDGDNHALAACGGDDCDDTDSNRFANNAEVCDAQDHDEDCWSDTVAGTSREEDPLTFDRMRDKDGDGYTSVECRNRDPNTGQITLAVDADCDDRDALVNPGAEERCDDEDNDCDGYIDEIEGQGQNYGLYEEFCLDHDRDGFGVHAHVLAKCSRPDGYVSCRSVVREDCDDDDPNVNPGNKVQEVCDTKDNDCDGKTDTRDGDVVPLVDQPTFPDTELRCTRQGTWVIDACPADRLWCNTSTALHGCERDATRLSSCRACETQCAFSCGRLGCDEVAALAVGMQHACALTQEGRVACWGRGMDGQLGDGGGRSSSVPSAVAGITAATAIAAGATHTCAIAGVEGALYCWGSNASRQLANPDAGSIALVPARVSGLVTNRLEGVVQVAAGEAYTCAVLGGGELLCWGETEAGRLGNLLTMSGPSVPQHVARLVPNTDPIRYADVDDAIRVTAGARHGCLITTEGLVECWGDNAAGQLGDPNAPLMRAYAAAVRGLVEVTAIAAGGKHTCALSRGRVFCWGLNDALQLGRASGPDDAKPLPVEGLPEVISLAAGWAFTCVQTRSSEVICWGSNAGGEIGLNATDASSMPNAVRLTHVIGLSAGGSACALTEEHRVACWGSNLFGQLGNGMTSLDPMPSPEPILPLAGSEQ